MSHQRGISLIEIMIAIAIVGIVIGLAISSLRGYSVNEAIRNVAEDMNGGIRQARMEAISRNTTVQFVSVGASWTIQVLQAGNPPQILVQRNARENETNIVVNPANLAITFNGQGFTTPFANFNVAISNPTQGACLVNGGDVRCLTIQISAGGRVRSCDPFVAQTDPRAC